MLCSFFLLLIHLPSLQFAFSNVVCRPLATTHLGSFYTLSQGAQTTRSACRRWPALYSLSLSMFPSAVDHSTLGKSGWLFSRKLRGQGTSHHRLLPYGKQGWRCLQPTSLSFIPPLKDVSEINHEITARLTSSSQTLIALLPLLLRHAKAMDHQAL